MIDDGFWNWLQDLYNDRDLNDEDLENCLNNPFEAYKLFMDFWSGDKYETGKEIQLVLKKFKEHIEKRAKNNAAGDSKVGSAFR